MQLVDAPTLPATLDPGASLDVRVGFEATRPDPEACAVTIVTDSVHDPEHRVPVRGFGTHDSVLVTETTWPEPGAVDLIVVVDDSPSMQAWQAEVATLLTALAEAWDALDLRLHVTTTSAAWNLGAAQKPSTIGIAGDILEQPLSAAWNAATHPGVLDPADHAPPLRAQAALEIIVVTDEADASPTPGIWSLMHDQLGGPWKRVRIHTVTAPTASSVQSLATLTGGQTATLSDDVQPLISNLIEGVLAAPVRHLPLSGVPGDWTAATVTIDGAKCTGGWEWDPLHNVAGSSTGGCLPGPGATVQVAVTAACP